MDSRLKTRATNYMENSPCAGILHQSERVCTHTVAPRMLFGAPATRNLISGVGRRFISVLLDCVNVVAGLVDSHTTIYWQLVSLKFSVVGTPNTVALELSRSGYRSTFVKSHSRVSETGP